MRDLVVVGAGPVGSHLAKQFSDRENDILVIERSEEIGKPLACSGHVSPDIWDFVPEDARDRLYQNEIRGARFHSGGKEYRFFRDETVSYVIDRIELDKVKAEQAREAGAKYRLGEEVREVEELKDRVKVVTDEEEYEARMVAGCDGAGSKVREEAGLGEPGKFYQGILGFSDEDDGSDFVDVHLEVPEFFGWRIPRGDSVEYGAAVPRGENPVEWLEKVTGKHGAEVEDICAGAIPVGPVDSAVSRRVFLAGDAAGQTKPFTGGGILYGMRAAEAAAETIDVERPGTLQDYERAWRQELGRDIRVGEFIRKTYSAPPIVQRAGMWFFEGEIGVHMDRPTSLLSFSQLRALLKR
ncbi:MAG: geranylgeranyl reductase family protein [Candidatus Nanohaloarchaea archaeon]